MSRTCRYRFTEVSNGAHGERRGGRAIVKEESRRARRENDKEEVYEGEDMYSSPETDE